MSQKSQIEWTESTWNPVTGCTKISSGCKNCYAERMAKRLKAMNQPNYLNGFKVKTHEKVLENPFKWKKPQVIFVNSMSDLFHKNVHRDFILKVFDTMNRADWHLYQVLTKRPRRAAEMDAILNWSNNIWMGTTVEQSRYTSRIDYLRDTSAKVKFLSLEPLLGPIPDMDLTNIDWVIVGGESGPGARPMMEEWVIDIKEQCESAKVPFFFKQWGGVRKKKNGRLLEGKTWDEMPRYQLCFV